MGRVNAFFRVELRSIFREPITVFFMVVLPLILTVVFGGAFGREMTQYGPDVLGIDTVVPVNIVFLLANVGLMGIPITILELKEQGVLKRYITYPIQYKTYFISLILAFSIVSIMSTFLFVALSFVGYGASYYMSLVETLIFVFLYLVIIYIFYAIGYLISLCIKSARTASLVTSGFFMALLFTSGVVLPMDSLPKYVQAVAKIFPMAHSIEVMQMLWIGQFNINNLGSNLMYLAAASIVLFIILRSVRIKWDA
ncbi:MAG: ABC transporter permease [Bacillota bacterium]